MYASYYTCAMKIMSIDEDASVTLPGGLTFLAQSLE